MVGKLIDARMKALDSNKDNKLSKEEASQWLNLSWEKIDKNKDGFVTREELMEASTDHTTGITTDDR